ncbi:hypothetical protein [Leptospira brenneri]|nr:hypothetical protein [Leptospira brenneri]
MFVLLDLLIGRLVYPVNSYPLTKDSMIVYLSLITGTEHMISLVMALAILLFSISFRKQTKGGMVFVVGIVTFGLQIIASFSWLISPGLLLLCRLSFPIWLVLAGFLLSKNKN